jgi:hypothetical protein
MYVCMHVCIYVMYVCIYIYACVCVCVCILRYPNTLAVTVWPFVLDTSHLVPQFTAPHPKSNRMLGKNVRDVGLVE